MRSLSSITERADVVIPVAIHFQEDGNGDNGGVLGTVQYLVVAR